MASGKEVYIRSARNIFEPRVLNSAHLVGKKRSSACATVKEK